MSREEAEPRIDCLNRGLHPTGEREFASTKERILRAAA